MKCKGFSNRQNIPYSEKYFTYYNIISVMYQFCGGTQVEKYDRVADSSDDLGSF